MSHPSALLTNIVSNLIGGGVVNYRLHRQMNGGATTKKSRKTNERGSFLPIFLVSLLVTAINGLIIYSSYNYIVPKLYHDRPFKPITWLDAIILSFLTHSLIW